MREINFKIYLFVFLFLIFFLLIIILFPFNRKKTSQNSNKNQLPTPTTIKTHPKVKTNISISPSLIPPTFTGGGKEAPPKKDIELATKKRELRLKTPLIENNFMITFDYNTDKFIVSLQKPEDQAKKDFEKWREKNYPEIPLDRFIFQTD